MTFYVFPCHLFNTFYLLKLVSKQLVGMLVVVLVKKSLKSYFGNVKTSTAGSGILGLMVLSRTIPEIIHD